MTDLSVPGLASRHTAWSVSWRIAARLLEKGPARLGQCDKMSRSMKESDSQLALEVLNLLGSGGCEM